MAQLVSYIAPAAPATRRPADGDEPAMRPEVGFTPLWYREKLQIDFGERWHSDPAYRRETVVSMRAELKRRFPGTRIGGIDRPDEPLDLLTGTYGACTVAGIYGMPIYYSVDNWPTCEHEYLSDEAIDHIEPPDLDTNPFFGNLIEQVDWIAESEGRVLGYLNWQGVLNNAQRLRGSNLFMDMLENPERARRLFDCVSTTMIDCAKRLRAHQQCPDSDFITVSNCLVNMVSPVQYSELLLPYDKKLAESFGTIGIHNCAWNANPYIDHYAAVPHVSYIDMGHDSDLPRARAAFGDARRAIMYTPMDLANKPLEEIRQDFEKIAREYAPCDIVLADIESGTPDARVLDVLEICAELSRDYPCQ